MFQILDAYLNQLQNEQDVSPIAEMQDYNESQVKGTISTIELCNSEDERESCNDSFEHIATTEL